MAEPESLVWKGKALTEKMRQAQILGVNATMSECVVHAKNNHPWKNQTTVLEGSIDIAEYAAPDARGVAGKWGSQDVEYALILELGGTIAHPGGTAFFVGEDGLAVFVSNADAAGRTFARTKPHDIVIPAYPYLRPAGDAIYPKLAKNIQRAHKTLGKADG